MTPADIEATFPGEHPLPHPVAEICNFLEAHGYPISGCFELSILGTDDLDRWFEDNPSVHDQLLPFGKGASGNVYALWLTDGLPSEHAPVVMLGCRR